MQKAHSLRALVSWDVVSMFPNIDNNLGISAVRKALNSRSAKIPSTDCLVEAVEICLGVNNCQFAGQSFVQKHGMAMGPKNACSYADLAMGIIDEKAKFEGSLRPMLWWRYRDDIFDLWTQGLPKLLEFTDYINDLYPTIKFELVYSESHLNVLDLTLYFRNGFISTVGILCLWEKYYIICRPNMATLNNRNELVSSCRHAKKFLLNTVILCASEIYF